jgi:alkylated DNA repair dioxygenase AlkB
MAQRRRSLSGQSELFVPAPRLPDGFDYREGLISPGEERGLAERFATLPFQPFEFHGYLGKRRIVSFGWRYDYGARSLRDSTAIPAFLLALREAAAGFARIPAASLQQVLVTEYEPGAGIGWHRDKNMFQDVIAVSFLAPCILRFRRKAGDGWQRAAREAAARSAYLLRGPARWEWQHSVPPVEALRYSVTFRNFVPGPRNGEAGAAR